MSESYKPTQGMIDEAKKGLEWRSEFGRGGTEVGIARARDISSGKNLSEDTVKRMYSFFSRHEVDKEAEGFRPGEDGYPSNGRIAWALWGGDAGFSWSRNIAESLDDEERQYLEEERAEEITGAMKTALENKVAEHNEEYGDTKTKRVTYRMLAAVFRRGIGAYKTNPESVRPNVKSPEQWALARVNSFLFAVRNGKFKSGKHDTDLFPEGHPLKSEEDRMDEERHIKNVTETDDSYIVEFGKSEDMDVEEPSENMADEEEYRLAQADLEKRYVHMSEKAIDQEKRTVMVGVSSEEPVERSFGMEVIDHSRENMNLAFLNSGRAPLLLNHDSDKVIGVIESVELDEQARRLRAKVRFGKSAMASEVFDDVVDGVRQNISIGYRVDGKAEKRENDPESYVRVKTTPMEISIVGIPADQSSLVGVGRSVSANIETNSVHEGAKVMTEVNLDAVRAESREAALKEAKAIMSLARKHNAADLGEKAIESGHSIEEFRGLLLDHIGDKPLDTPAANVEVSQKESKRYSLGRMVQAQVTGDWTDAGFEREIHKEIAKRVGKESQGIYVPTFAFGQRSGIMTTAATGAIAGENVSDNFVPTIHRGDMFIEALRARQVMAGLGVTYMGGLTNRVKMPKFSTGASAGFVEESGDVSDQSQTDASVTLQPRTMGARAVMSRLLMLESVPAIDQVVQDDLLMSMADRLEYFAINGSGSGGQPTGLLNAGIGNYDISAGTDVDSLTWADIIQIAKTVENANGIVNQNAVGWLSSPAVKAKMASTARVSGTDSVFLLNDPWNTLYGHPIAFTTNVLSTYDPGDAGNDASALFYGDFSQLLIGIFGAPSILVDPYTYSNSGDVQISIFQEVDVAVRNTESFAKSDEISVA